MPTLACALPNFAALAPSPTTAPQTTDDTVSTTEPTADPTTPLALNATIASPKAPSSIDSLPSPPDFSVESSAQYDLKTGQNYLVNQPAQFSYQPVSGRPIVIRTSAGVQLQFPGDVSLNAQIQQNSAETIYLLVSFPSPLNFTISDLAQAAQLRVAELDGGHAKIVDTADFVGQSELKRTELLLTEGVTYVVILQPDGALDAVVELYDTAGIQDSSDVGGMGEAEILVFSAPQAAKWALVTYSYLSTAGSYTLEVFEVR